MKLEKLATELKKVREILTMERASFENICSDPRGTPQHNGAPLTERRVTEFIRERTRLWRESWILGPLDEAIAEIDAERAKLKARR